MLVSGENSKANDGEGDALVADVLSPFDVHGVLPRK